LLHLSRLDGEGVFTFFHPHLQILDFTPLLLDKQVLNAIQPYLDPLDILFAGRAFEPFVDHRGELFNGGDVVLRHMYLSIAGRRGVSSSSHGGDDRLLAGLPDDLIGLDEEP
jgi:hypothetical protein